MCDPLLPSCLPRLYEEVDNVYAEICEQAQAHIHADECILTYGDSAVIEKFLKAAAKKRRFQVIIAESAPAMDGHRLAIALAKVSNIAVTLIPDSNIYAIMARVNKVIFTPVAVMADGGAICSSGHLMVAVAAKEYSVPVVGINPLLINLCHHNFNNLTPSIVSQASLAPSCSPRCFRTTKISC
jgi:translation initiation factor eIF-2B subunit beta